MKALLVALLVTLAATPAVATDDAWLGCYTRVYDAQHLVDNPGQKIRTVTLELSPSDMEQDVAAYLAGIWVTTTYDDRRYVSGGYCLWAGEGIDCGMDGDAGRFTLQRTDKGVRLQNTEGFFLEDMEGEDPSEGILVEADKDHRVFVLYRADPADCR
jgi:hypothetical protein